MQNELSLKLADIQDLNDIIEMKEADLRQIEEEIDQYQRDLEDKEAQIDALMSQNEVYKKMVEEFKQKEQQDLRS